MSRKNVLFGSLWLCFCLFLVAGNLPANTVIIEVDLSATTGLKYSFGYEDKNGKMKLGSGDLMSGFLLKVNEESWSILSLPSENKVVIDATSPKRSWWVKVDNDPYGEGAITVACNITSGGYPSQVLAYINGMPIDEVACDSGSCSKNMTLSSSGSPFSFSIQMTANGPIYYPAPSPSSIILVGSSLSLFLGFPSLSIFRLGLKKRIL